MTRDDHRFRHEAERENQRRYVERPFPWRACAIVALFAAYAGWLFWLVVLRP